MWKYIYIYKTKQKTCNGIEFYELSLYSIEKCGNDVDILIAYLRQNLQIKIIVTSKSKFYYRFIINQGMFLYN